MVNSKSQIENNKRIQLLKRPIAKQGNWAFFVFEAICHRAWRLILFVRDLVFLTLKPVRLAGDVSQWLIVDEPVQIVEQDFKMAGGDANGARSDVGRDDHILELP